MSRIVISVTNESGFDIRDIVIKGAVGTGVLDPATGDFTAKAGAEASDVTANTATAEKVYYALLVPQNGVQLKVTVTTADGKMRTQTLGTADLKSGENRRMDCNVQPADIQVKFSGPITGWVDGDDLLPDGDGEVETPTVEWGGVKYKIVTLKDGRTWMAENLRYVPEGKTISSDPKGRQRGVVPLQPLESRRPVVGRDRGPAVQLSRDAGNDRRDDGHQFRPIRGCAGHLPRRVAYPDEGRVAQAGGCRQRQPVRPDIALFRKRRRGGGSIAALNKDGFILRAAAISMRRAPRRPRPIWPRRRLPTLRRSAWDISPARPATRLLTIRPTIREAASRTSSIMPV